MLNSTLIEITVNEPFDKFVLQRSLIDNEFVNITTERRKECSETDYHASWSHHDRGTCLERQLTYHHSQNPLYTNAETHTHLCVHTLKHRNPKFRWDLNLSEILACITCLSKDYKPYLKR